MTSQIGSHNRVETHRTLEQWDLFKWLFDGGPIPCQNAYHILHMYYLWLHWMHCTASLLDPIPPNTACPKNINSVPGCSGCLQSAGAARGPSWSRWFMGVFCFCSPLPGMSSFTSAGYQGRVFCTTSQLIFLQAPSSLCWEMGVDRNQGNNMYEWQ